jgi:hypothetical protein
MLCPCFFGSSNQYSRIQENEPNEHNSTELTSISNPYNGHHFPSSTPNDGHGSQSVDYTTASSSGTTASLSPVNRQSTSNSKTPQSQDSVIFRNFPDSDNEKEFDENLPVFKGLVVQQKFFNKSTYDPKFVWINLVARTLCLSEHTVKERRHKEALLADITGVIAGPPEKYKAQVSPSNEESAILNADLCLSVKFVRGGGIDLKFQTVEERNTWYQVITRLILQEKELHRISSGVVTSSSASISTNIGTQNQ